MTQNFTTDVLVCGTGAAGLTIAVDLARRNVAFQLIEKMDGPFCGSRGKGIQPRSQEVFEDLGLITKLFAAGGPYPLQRFHKDREVTDSVMVEQNAPSPAEPYQYPLLVPQFRTEAVLRERLAELGHPPQYGRELTSFEQDEEGVTARVKFNGETLTIRARYLVGADGGRSIIRKSLDIKFVGETLGVRALVADVLIDGLERDAWHRWGDGESTSISLCPLIGTEMFQLQCSVISEGEVDISANGLTSMLTQRTGRTDLVIKCVSWASVYKMSARLADRYQVGRIFLVGDSAHVHPPTGGQGLNTSIQDAYNLGWKLASVLMGAPKTLLETYEMERRPIAAEMLGLTTSKLQSAKKGDFRRGREVQQLDLSYPASNLILEKPARVKGIRGGSRAPDAPVVGANGQQTRLFTLFQGPHWTLLGYHVDQNTSVTPRGNLHIYHIGPHGDIFDDAGHFLAAYELEPREWILIRPDGYVGAIVSADEIETMENYMTRVGLSQLIN